MKTFRFLLPFSVLFFCLFSCKDEEPPLKESEVNANFSVSKDTITVGENVSFTDLSSGNPSSRSWTFNGGTPSISEEINPVVTYSDPGEYDVSLTAINSLGSDDTTKTKTVIVLPVGGVCPQNASIACAQDLTTGTEIKGSFTEPEQENYYSITTTTAGVLEVTINSVPADMAIKLEILSEDEKVVATANGNTGTNIFFESLIGAGQYYIRLTEYRTNSNSEEEFNLLVSFNTDDSNEMNNSFDEATELTLGETIKGTIRTVGDKDYFFFTTSEAGVVEVLVSNIDPEVGMRAILYNASQAEIVKSPASDGGNLTYEKLLDAGTYYLQLYANYSSRSSKQIYQLEISLNTDDPNEMNNKFETATSILLGEEVKGTIRSKADKDFYVFTTEQAGVVEILVSNIDPDLGLRATFYDANQAEIAKSAVSNEGNLTHNLLLSAGTYYVQLNDNFNISSSSQVYNFTISLNTDDPNELNNTIGNATEILLGEPVFGTFRSAGDRDYFVFTTTKAGSLEVMISNIDQNLTIYGNLYDINQAEVARLPYSKEGNLFYEKNLEAGTYYLRLLENLDFRKGNEIYKLTLNLK